MFLHQAMAFDARRELLDYGYACGQRTARSALSFSPADLPSVISCCMRH